MKGDKNLSEPSNSLEVPVLHKIQPPRELLKGSIKPNSIYLKQLNELPFIMNSCNQFSELALNIPQQPIIIDPESAKLIYRREIQLKLNPFQSKNYFKTLNIQSRIQPPKAHIPPKQGELVFESHFESGNLLQARKDILSQRYHLLMQNDINTYGCTQWFFFKTLNKQKLKATFCINNFYKPESLYRYGMKVLVFSKKRFLEEGVGWVRGGQNFSYFENKAVEKKDNGAIAKQFYTLKFDFHFDFEEDETFFAYNYPYTYTKLNSYLNERMQEKNDFYQCRTLCKTVAENNISLITITDNHIAKQKKNTVFITSRVHPGETVSSLVMEGIIDFLTSHTQMAVMLRKKFIFRLIPMLNPDGVIHGNYRTNLAGIDLNRVWNNADKQLSPEIFELKKFILECDKESPILMFCDIHGHSARKSAFIYGCEQINTRKNLKKNNKYQSRLFPFMLSSENEDFRYPSCNFKIQKNKEGTARIQLWKQLQISNIFTLECSFCSAENSSYHFRPSDYRQIGISFCKTVHQYFLNQQKKQHFIETLKKIQEIPTDAKQDSDSESISDLYDERTLKKLKKGDNKITSNRKLEFENEEVGRKNSSKLSSTRRLFNEKAHRSVKTEESVSFSRKKVVQHSQPKKITQISIPTKKIVFETQSIKPMLTKFIHRKDGPVIRKIDNGYRGKSSLYRIKKHLTSSYVEQNKQSIVLAFDAFVEQH